ncbi:MAG: DivIVA domain-containing protein [bacterium]
MGLTPVELRDFEFGRKLRGYDPEEVDSLIEAAAESLESQIKESSRLKQDLTTLKERLVTYENIEQSLKEALVNAQEAAKQQQTAAEQEIKLKLERAELERRETLSRNQQELEYVNRQIADLKQLKSSYLAEMRALIETHLRLLEGHQQHNRPERQQDDEPVYAGGKGDQQHGPA